MVELDREGMFLETKGALLRIVEEDLRLPEPEIEFKERLEECDKAGLVVQKEDTIYEMRISQFKSLGFYPMSTAEAIELLMGEPYTDVEEQSKRQNYDYFFRHNEYTVKKDDCTWGINNPDYYLKKETQGSWFLPPFRKQVAWTVEPVFSLDDFCVPIPTPLLTALNYMRTKGFFNLYLGYQCRDQKKAVLLGSVLHMVEGANKASHSRRFFLGVF